MLSCDDIKARLTEIYGQLKALSQPGVRSVRDSDGSVKFSIRRRA
jgi:hypothetical protein